MTKYYLFVLLGCYLLERKNRSSLITLNTQKRKFVHCSISHVFTCKNKFTILYIVTFFIIKYSKKKIHRKVLNTFYKSRLLSNILNIISGTISIKKIPDNFLNSFDTTYFICQKNYFVYIIWHLNHMINEYFQICCLLQLKCQFLSYAVNLAEQYIR